MNLDYSQIVETDSGPKPIGALKVGDRVLTLSPKGNLVQIRLASKEVLGLTPNHLIHTKNGWVEVGSFAIQEPDHA